MGETLKLLKYLPINYNLVKRLFTNFSNLYYSDGVIYSLPICRVFELRGHQTIIELNKSESKQLLLTCGEIADESSALGLLFTKYTHYQEVRPRKGARQITQFVNFIPHIINNPTSLQHLKDMVI